MLENNKANRNLNGEKENKKYNLQGVLKLKLPKDSERMKSKETIGNLIYSYLFYFYLNIIKKI